MYNELVFIDDILPDDKPTTDRLKRFAPLISDYLNDQSTMDPTDRTITLTTALTRYIRSSMPVLCLPYLIPLTPLMPAQNANY